MNSFKTIIPVHYFELNNHREASPVAVLNYLEETAIRHSETVGCGIDRLLDEGKGWVLTRWSVNITDYPLWNESVAIETWPSSFHRFYATREFRTTGPGGRLLGVATSLWVFLDLNRKRPVRIPDFIQNAYGKNPVRMIEDGFPDLPGMDKPENSLSFRVRLSDIDSNNHVNNTRYAEWILEAAPLSLHRDFRLSTMEIAYKKETGYGSSVISECAAAEYAAAEYAAVEHTAAGFPGTEQILLHRILDSGTGTELVRARTVWLPRS